MHLYSRFGGFIPQSSPTKRKTLAPLDARLSFRMLHLKRRIPTAGQEAVVPVGECSFYTGVAIVGSFVALRERPDARGKLVARMKPGDEVMLNNTVADKNGWTRVYWKGGRFQGQTVKGIEAADGQGWVNSKLLGECGRSGAIPSWTITPAPR